MMSAQITYRGRTYKTVTVTNVTDDDTDTDILDLALRRAGETRSSLFGWYVRRADATPSIVSVNLHTD